MVGEGEPGGEPEEAERTGGANQKGKAVRTAMVG